MVEALLASDPREIGGYELRGRLGAGGMGVVYLSYSRGGQPVALKVVRREYAEDPEFRRRFAREVESARRVQGPYTAPVLDSNVTGPQPWLAGAYVPGPSLAEAVRRHGPLPAGTGLSLVAGVAEALSSVHAAGVVHRDLKPTNVLLAADGPRVIDFGIARSADATALTGTDVRLGTPAYMSPEQAMGRTAGPEIDIFALGMVAFYAVTGGHPFGEGDGHALLFRIVSQEPDLAACPEQLRDIVARCLAKEPGDRPGPAEVVELCRARAGGSFERGTGWWLPEPVTTEIIRRQQEPLPALPPPLPQPAAGRPADAAAWPTASADRPGTGRASGAGPHRLRPLPAFAIGVVTAGLLAGGAAFLITQLQDDGGGTGREQSGSGSSSGAGATAGGSEDGAGGRAEPREPAGWKVVKADEPLVVRPPAEEGDAFAECSAAPSTFVDLDSLTVTTGSNHGNLVAGDQTLEYMNCGEDGSDPDSGLKLLDNKGIMGSVDRRDVSPAECREAARSADLPNPVTIPDIQDDSVLKDGMGICVETAEKNVVLLWITRVDEHPDNHDLRTYVTRATQWKPDA